MRENGQIPAVVYGSSSEPKIIQINSNEFKRVYREAGRSALLDLAIDGKEPIKVLIQDFQVDPLKDTAMHVDFFQVDRTQPLHTDIELRFVGVAPAVKELGGTLVYGCGKISVKALPDDLVRYIDVNVSVLVNFESIIRIGNLALPKGIELDMDQNTTVASIMQPRSEEELAALEGAVVEDVTKVEVAGAKKEEEVEEGAEAEAGPEGKKE